MSTSKEDVKLGGTYTLPGTTRAFHRMGYGAMQLAGPGVYGPPRDKSEALAVLREVVLERGVDHIDTSDFYGPHVTNQIIREALHPYPEALLIVTKVGARRAEDKGWYPAISPAELTSAVHDNLRNLGMERLHVVNLRVMGPDVAMEEPYAHLAGLQQQGLIEHLGVSNVTPQQFAAAKAVAPVVCVQNLYNVAFREDDAFIDDLAAQNVPYMPYFPLGGFKPLQMTVLGDVAASVRANPTQVALAWLLQRSPNICLIPGTSSREHLRENLQAAQIQLPSEACETLDLLGSRKEWLPPHR